MGHSLKLDTTYLVLMLEIEWRKIVGFFISFYHYCCLRVLNLLATLHVFNLSQNMHQMHRFMVLS